MSARQTRSSNPPATPSGISKPPPGSSLSRARRAYRRAGWQMPSTVVFQSASRSGTGESQAKGSPWIGLKLVEDENRKYDSNGNACDAQSALPTTGNESTNIDGVSTTRAERDNNAPESNSVGAKPAPTFPLTGAQSSDVDVELFPRPSLV
ncbi:hypothetical protein I317_07105 [Kwoniella heveanensis CBS 569]|nr:hypothetical protein I317_07105 [Kwoniella heveanensis CBS 569]